MWDRKAFIILLTILFRLFSYTTFLSFLIKRTFGQNENSSLYLDANCKDMAACMEKEELL